MSHLRAGWRVGAVWHLLAVALLLSSCTWSNQEPGLLGRPTSPPTAAAPTTSDPTTTSATPSVGADLPVVGEEVWTSPEGPDVQLRIALHAIRRIPGGTVLDWSITPLNAPELVAGDALPESVDLGLTRWGEDVPDVTLIDVPGGWVYRPVTRAQAGGQGCVCTPLRVAQHQLRIGETLLLQITYPVLRTDLGSIDVNVATVPIFTHVPVTDEGFVPGATSPTDLARAAERTSITATTPVFSYAPGGQRFVLSVDSVVASSTFTTVRWTIQSLSNGAGLRAATAAPFAATDGMAQLANPRSATGPQVIVHGPLAADLSVYQITQGPRARACLCSDFRLWPTALRQAQQQASVVTNVPPVPVGAQQVDVAFPGLATLRGIPLTVAEGGAVRSAAPTRQATRTYAADHPPAGWTVDHWPTPVPDSRRLGDNQSTLDRLIG